jgi:hypothetical protein
MVSIKEAAAVQVRPLRLSRSIIRRLFVDVMIIFCQQIVVRKGQITLHCQHDASHESLELKQCSRAHKRSIRRRRNDQFIAAPINAKCAVSFTETTH